jgi:hypothetical protein
MPCAKIRFFYSLVRLLTRAMKHHMRIPDESAWHGFEGDLDVQWMHKYFFGKSNDEVQEYFGEGRSIERMDELLHAPRPVFQYYVRAFAQFVMSQRAKGDSDSASPFLALLEEREKRDPGSVVAVYGDIESCLDFVAKNQSYFDAPIDIYGDFNERAEAIRRTCGA